MQLAIANPIRYRGYYYDTDIGLYYLNARYYSPELRRFISPDDTSYLDPENANGLNLYAYCYNDPVYYADPSGHFVITAAMIWSAIKLGVLIGAGIAAVSTVSKDLENGNLFDGDVTLRSYLGNILGGGIAGAGVGLCSILGVGLGMSLSAGTVLMVGGTAISGGVAFTIGVSGAFISGGLGYALQAGISDQVNFQWSDMFIEASINAASGAVTFIGAMCGAIGGVKFPPGNKFLWHNFWTYHKYFAIFGGYPMKVLLSRMKKYLKEYY